MLKIMKRIGRDDDERPILSACDHLLEIALPSAFRIFRNDHFRKLVHFEKLSEEEQNRVFNELETSALCLTLLALGALDNLVKPENLHFWKKVQDKLPHFFENHLGELGADKDNASLFRKLIAMRYEEYVGLTSETWDFWEEEEKQLRMLPNDTAKHSIARVHALSIGTADHIMRGNIDQAKPLPGFLRDWFFELNERVGKFVKFV